MGIRIEKHVAYGGLKSTQVKGANRIPPKTVFRALVTVPPVAKAPRRASKRAYL